MPDELSDLERGILAVYREEEAPGRETEKRLLARLQRDAAPARATASGKHTAWLWAGLAVAASVAALAVLRPTSPERIEQDAPSHAARVHEQGHGEGTASVRREKAADGTPAPESQPEPEEKEPPTAQRVPPKPEPVRPKSARPEPEASPTSTLRRETELLRKADASLREGKAERAIEELEAYAREFPKGLLHIDYRGLRAVALCTAGRHRQGRGEARVFLGERPRAALSDRIRAVCGPMPSTDTGESGHSHQGGRNEG